MSLADLFRVDGKVAVVTGGSRGLGLTMAEGLLRAGAARVYLSSRAQADCDEAAAALNKLAAATGLRGEAVGLAADGSTEEGIAALVEGVRRRDAAGIDILVANAGTQRLEQFGDHMAEALDMVLGVNLKGVFLTIQAFAPLLEQKGAQDDPSRVVVTGSTAALRTGRSGGMYGYLASKAGVMHLAKTLAVELGPSCITVNSIAPGFFPSRMADGLLSIIGDQVVADNPLGRLGEPNDLMGVVVYLCSRAGRYINGAVIPLDGAQHLSGNL